MENRAEKLLDNFSSKQKDMLKSYLRQRCIHDSQNQRLNVVFDLLHQCDFNCIGCGTNAQYVGEQKLNPSQMTIDQIRTILEKIHEYTVCENLVPFINFGGGEPFLRSDILEILKMCAEMFGVASVGIDTNASLAWSYDAIAEAMKYVSYVGISINGLHDYHNWWSNNSKIDAFDRATTVIKKLCCNESYAEKLEVTTVATKKNYKTIPDLMRQMKKIGVQHFSVHRAIPVGRMAYWQNKLEPSALEYLHLLVNIAETSNELTMDAHLHHSIEAIYGTLLCGIKTYCSENFVDTNYRSSIAVDPSGSIYPNPWCTTGFWKKLSIGNILKEDVSLSDIFAQSAGLLIELRKCYAIQKRCFGCILPCSGGHRIVAAATILNQKKQATILAEDILKAMLAVDPACPLSETKREMVG